MGKSEGYIVYSTEFNYVYTRIIIKTRIVSLVEYIRIVKYKSGFYTSSYEPDRVSLFYNKAITFSNNPLNYNDKLITKLLRLLFDRSYSISSFDKISKSKYMKLDFVGVIVRKHHKVFTRNEKLKDLGI